MRRGNVDATRPGEHGWAGNGRRKNRPACPENAYASTADQTGNETGAVYYVYMRSVPPPPFHRQLTTSTAKFCQRFYRIYFISCCCWCCFSPCPGCSTSARRFGHVRRARSKQKLCHDSHCKSFGDGWISID